MNGENQGFLSQLKLKQRLNSVGNRMLEERERIRNTLGLNPEMKSPVVNPQSIPFSMESKTPSPYREAQIRGLHENYRPSQPMSRASPSQLQPTTTPTVAELEENQRNIIQGILGSQTTSTPTPTAMPTSTPTPTLSYDKFASPDYWKAKNPGVPEYDYKMFGTTPKELQTSTQAIRDVANMIGVPASLLEDIAYQESKYDYDLPTTTEGSTATGLFQFNDPTWTDVVNKYGMSWEDRLDAYQNALAAAKLINEGYLGKWAASADIWAPHYTLEEVEPYLQTYSPEQYNKIVGNLGGQQ